MDEQNELIKNAPILEWDEDSAENQKTYFFEQGKKPFEQFDIALENGVNKCLIFFPRAFEECKEVFNLCEKIYEFKSASTISPVYLYDKKLLIALCPLGGPSAANLMEELDYVGISTFVACGTCGSVVDFIDMEKYFIPLDAIRDEGLSYHYLKASRKVETCDEINNALKKAVEKHGKDYITGTIWTCDAMYRETPNRTKRRVAEGAIGVDMECASLAACAKFNNIKFGSLVYFTDRVKDKTWEWRLYDRVKLRTELLNICIDALLSL